MDAKTKLNLLMPGLSEPQLKLRRWDGFLLQPNRSFVLNIGQAARSRPPRPCSGPPPAAAEVQRLGVMSIGQVEVEVYVKTVDRTAVISALSKYVGLLSLCGSPEGGVYIYQAEGVSAVLQPSEDGFLSVWVRGNSDWSSCATLGRYLANELRSIVRCDPGGEFPEVSPYSNVFLEISGDGESLVPWG
jgi:hypothetical protein